MRIGLFTLATDRNMPFHLLALEAEQRGFDIIFTGEHSHIPVGAQVWSGGGLPPHYRRILDPFVTLGAAAVSTSRIKLGTAVCLLAVHDPLHFAKLVTTLDLVSRGRAVIGLGYGYIDREIENHGVSFKDRKDVFRDKMRAVHQLWTHDVATYKGPHVSFADVEQYPKPFKGRRPPVLLGAKLRGETIRDMIEFCDGWLPSAMMGGDHLAEDIARLKGAWKEAGRDVDSLEITVFHTARTGEERRADDWGAATLTEEIVNNYEKSGTTTLCVPLSPVGGRDQMLRDLDGYARIFKSHLRT